MAEIKSQINLKNTINGAIKTYEFKVNSKNLQENLIALEEFKNKNGQSYLTLIANSENAKITALGVIKLANKGLIFGKDFNIIPFKNKLTTIIDSRVYQKRIEQEGWFPKKSVIFKNETFEWDTDNQKPKLHKINFDIDTGKLENIIGAYAFAKNKLGQEKGILIRKSDIQRWKTSSPSGNSNFSPWNSWPKEMVEAKLYRKLAQELGIDIKDIDLDEKEITNTGDSIYIPFKEIIPNNKENIPTNNNQEIINTPTIQSITINESIPQETFNFEQEQKKLESLNLD